MPKQYIKICGQQFGKTECKEFFKDMLNRYELNDFVNQQDFLSLSNLLEYHSKASEKIGCGVINFQIVPEYGHRRFDIVRTDGSRCDFSYGKCTSKPRYPHRKEVMRAMRCEILDQIRNFRDEQYDGKKYVRCGITNLNVQKKDCHIDHQPPKDFQVLVFDFLKEHKLTFGQIKVDDADDIGLHSVRYISDPSIKTTWKEYHAINAVLRVTSDKANLGQKKSVVNFECLVSNSEKFTDYPPSKKEEPKPGKLEQRPLKVNPHKEQDKQKKNNK